METLNPNNPVKDHLAGYATIQPVRRSDVQPNTSRKFELIDFTENTKKQILLEPKKRETRGKKKKAPRTVMDEIKSDNDEDYDIKEPVQSWENIDEPTPHTEERVKGPSVKIKTDLAEMDVDAKYVEVAEHFICVFVYGDSKIKLRPKQGATFTLDIEGEEHKVYSPGVWFQPKGMDCEVVFLLVQPGETE